MFVLLDSSVTGLARWSLSGRHIHFSIQLVSFQQWSTSCSEAGILLTPWFTYSLLCFDSTAVRIVYQVVSTYQVFVNLYVVCTKYISIDFSEA